MSMPNYRNLVTATALTSALLALAGCGQALGFLLRRQLGLRLNVLLEGFETAQVFDSGLAG